MATVAGGEGGVGTSEEQAWLKAANEVVSAAEEGGDETFNNNNEEEENDGDDGDGDFSDGDDQYSTPRKKKAAAASVAGKKKGAATVTAKKPVKKVAAAKKTAAGSSTEGTAPAPASKKAAKAAGDSKPKKFSGSADEAQQQVMEYMKQTSRPYNSTAVFENLHRSIGHTAVKAALDALVVKGDLSASDSTNKIYWINQANVQPPDADLLKSLDAQVETLRENVEGVLSKECNELVAAIAILEKQPKDSEIEGEIKKQKQAISNLEGQIEKLQEEAEKAASEMISSTIDLQELRKELNFYKREWKLRKGAVDDVLSNIAMSSGGKNYHDLADECALETDENAQAIMPPNDL